MANIECSQIFTFLGFKMIWNATYQNHLDGQILYRILTLLKTASIGFCSIFLQNVSNFLWYFFITLLPFDQINLSQFHQDDPISAYLSPAWWKIEVFEKWPRRISETGPCPDYVFAQPFACQCQLLYSQCGLQYRR